MKKKLTILAFGLLLAVGWTNGAQAQKLETSNRMLTSSIRFDGHSEVVRIAESLPQGQKLNAPQRSASDLNASVVHPKSWYESQSPITWTDLQGASHTTLLTEPVTDANGMIALVKRIYTDPLIPGAKYSAPQGCDIPYQTIQYGWNIQGTNYQSLDIVVSTSNARVLGIVVTAPDGTELYSLWPNGNNAPTGWRNTTYNNQYYCWYPYSSGTITIPASALQNSQGYAHIEVYATTTSTSTATIQMGNSQFGYYSYDLTYGTVYIYPYDLPGTITPPNDAGYTVMLVKLKDGVNDDANNRAPMYTANEDSLRDYFTTYISEIQLLTDGMRVGSGDNAGTVFAYTGDLNRFYHISKGKMAFLSSLDSLGYDRAPFYSMYEEFAPVSQEDESGFDDFYEKMKQGETYNIIHDCNSVNFMQHYFSMAGKSGTTWNHVNSLVLYIPDYRGGTADDWRNYVTNHQPTVGMYMIDLYADIVPSATQTDYYTVTVDWTSNLDSICHTDGIDQTYNLYQIIGNDTTLVYTGPNTTWSQDYPVGDPSAYDISYFVIGTPDDATNKDTFFAKSNTDDVTVPGNSDFIGLQWWRYESDYVTNDGTNQEVNYYRNFLAPHALAVQGEAGINAGNVGTAGRTLTLYRDETPIIDLELVMNGNKAYYRIKYRNRNENQQVEPGYDPNTGELLNTNN